MASSKARYVPPVGSTPPKLPIEGQRNILITSALPYVNNVPHLGNIIGCVLSADVYARFCRQRGHNAIYICGTDEYGTATETKALKEGLTPQQICDKYHVIHRDVYRWFECSFDFFGRTTTPQQTEIAQDIFTRLHQRGLLQEDAVVQLHCGTCNKFLADRFVEGVCPLCGYGNARGDQCDGCGKLLNPIELVSPKCATCASTPSPRTSTHLFIDLPKLAEPLTAFVEANAEPRGWTDNSVNITQSWLKAGLNPRCITRDLKWGTPVPLDGFRDKVFYVWFDAPIGYISITANYTPEWRRWWKNPSQVELHQFMGKDNVPFHTILFPASLIGADDNYTLLHHISTTEYLQYENDKFSKSRGVGVFGDAAAETGIPASIWRYYLLSNRPERADSEFTWADFLAKNNNELLNNLGNFCNRILKFCAAKYAKVVPGLGAPLRERDNFLIASANVLLSEYNLALERSHIKEGLRKFMELSAAGNLYLQDTKPWDLFKSDKAYCDTVVTVALNFAYLLAATAAPYMPGFASAVLTQLGLVDPNVTGEQHPYIPDSFDLVECLGAGHTIGEPEPLIRKIDDAEAAALRARFAGSPAETTSAAPAASASAGAGAGASAAPAPAAASGVDVAEVQRLVGLQGALVRKIKEAKDTFGADELAGAVAVLKFLKGLLPAEPAAAASSAGNNASTSKGAGGASGKPSGKAAPAKASGGGGGGGEDDEDDGASNECPFDLRVGRVTEAVRHASSDKLYILKVDVGTAAGGVRQICAGLQQHYAVEALVGRRVLVVANLKAAKLGGVESDGMLLAAAHPDGTGRDTVALVTPGPENGDVGTQAVCAGGQLPVSDIARRVKASKLRKYRFAVGADGTVELDGVPLLAAQAPLRPDPAVAGIVPGDSVN